MLSNFAAHLVILDFLGGNFYFSTRRSLCEVVFDELALMLSEKFVLFD
jgi:hypothetical protein